jgi:hypothetical protein
MKIKYPLIGSEKRLENSVGANVLNKYLNGLFGMRNKKKSFNENLFQNFH